MHLKPPPIPAPPRWLTLPVEWLLTGLYLAIFGIPLLVMMAVWRAERRISPDWHPVFAWWPTRCDDWLNDGFVGTVWLETIERRNKFPHGVEFRRPPARERSEHLSPPSSESEGSRDEPLPTSTTMDDGGGKL